MRNAMKRNVLITGASGNIGRAAVEKFIQEGFNVIATASPRGLGYSLTNLSVYEADLTDEKSVEDVIAKIISVHQTIDVAILTVGSFAVGSIETTDGAAIQKMMSLNFNTAYFTARPVFKQMMKQKTGRIILIGSRPALVAAEGKNTLAYALSKSLVFKLAELLNAEATGNDVVVSVLVPGIIDTPENRKSNPSANFSDWVTSESIVDAMLYLVSPNAKALRDPVLKLYSNS